MNVDEMMGAALKGESVIEMDRRIQARKILAHCPTQDEEGNPVRGYVTKVICRCGHVRWNDGTRCGNFVTPGRKCGMYTQDILNQTDGEDRV